MFDESIMSLPLLSEVAVIPVKVNELVGSRTIWNDCFSFLALVIVIVSADC